MNLEGIYDSAPIPIQNLMCSVMGLKLKTQRYSKAFHRRVDFLLASANWTASEIETYQIDRFNRILGLAVSTVPYYRDLAKRFQIPDQIKSISELSEFPTIEKRDLKANPAYFVSENSTHHFATLSTSGSTGTPLQVVLSRAGLTDIFAMIWRQRQLNGICFGDKTATFNGRRIVPVQQSDPPFWRRNVFMKQTLFSQYHVSEENLWSYVRELDRGRFKLWFGYPSFVGTLAKHVETNGISLANSPILIQTGSETLLPHIRSLIARAIGSQIRNNYGCSEGCVSISECAAGLLHVDNEMCIVEFQPITGDGLNDSGHLLVTGLSNTAMPLIRYRIGDVASRYDSVCACGRPGPAFLSIDGRLEDSIITPSGSRVGRLDHLFKSVEKIAECQIVQNSPDSIDLRIVRMPGYGQGEENQIRENVKQHLGDDLRVVFQYVNSIDRLPNGKFRAVINNLAR